MKNLNINKELTKKIKSFYKRLEEENLDATIEPEIVCEKEVYRIKYNVHLKDFFTIVVDDLNDEAINMLNRYNTYHIMISNDITIGKDWCDYWNEGVSAEEYKKIREEERKLFEEEWYYSFMEKLSLLNGNMKKASMAVFMKV